MTTSMLLFFQMILRVILTVILLCIATCHSLEKGDGFQVFRVLPTTNQQLLQMIRLFETADTDRADFWHAPSVVNGTVDIMVAPEHTGQFQKYLEKHGYTYQIAIQDLRTLLIEKEGNILTHSTDDAFFMKRLHDDVGFHSRLRCGILIFINLENVGISEWVNTIRILYYPRGYRELLRICQILLS